VKVLDTTQTVSCSTTVNTSAVDASKHHYRQTQQQHPNSANLCSISIIIFLSPRYFIPKGLLLERRD